MLPPDRRPRDLVIGVIGSLTVAAGVATAAGQSGLFTAGSTPVDGVAAGRGRVQYAATCASCHGAELGGSQFGPPLKGAAFQARWRGRASAELLNYISTRMPPTAPGGLGSGAYADLTAFILTQTDPAAAPLALTGIAPASGELVRKPAAVEHSGGFGIADFDPGLKPAKAALAARLSSLTPVSQEALKAPPPGEWLMWRGGYATLGFSPLRAINRANAGKLREAWSWTLPVSQNEIAPLVHGGVLFVKSGATVQALDAKTGDLLWQYVRPLADEYDSGRASRLKAIAIYGSNLYFPTPDGHMVALDMKSGKPVWDEEVFSAAKASSKGQFEGVALHMEGGPLIAHGKVIVGVSLGQVNGNGGCFILALDAETGAQAWRFNTIPKAGEPGGDTWNGAPSEERFGAGVWTAGSYDPDSNLVYFGTGNTYDTATLLQPRHDGVSRNDALYTDTTLALDADTGRLVWHYQHVKRDVWDLDWVFEQSLVDVKLRGVPRKLVVTGGKMAIFDALDRSTGKYVFSRDLGLQNVVSHVDTTTGEKMIDPSVEPEAGKAKFMCPGPLGGRNWPATAIDPNSSVLFVPMIEMCADYTYEPRSPDKTAKGGSDAHFRMRLRPGADGKFGRVAAVDLQSGRTLWTRRGRAPIAGSLLATAGGVLFSGDRDRRFRALDDATGATLWEVRLGASPSSSPITYAVDGQQYVAVVSGGGGPFDAGTGSLATEITGPGGATTLHVFKLAH